MCKDKVTYYHACGHVETVHGTFCCHLLRDLRSIDDPYYFSQPGIPYRQSAQCAAMTRYDVKDGLCRQCSGWENAGSGTRTQMYVSKLGSWRSRCW